MIVLVLSTFVFVLLLNYFYKKWKVYSLILSNFASAPRHPILGHLSFSRKTPPEIFESQIKLIKTYGKNVAFARPILVCGLLISDAKDIESILSNPNTKKARKAQGYKSMEPWLGTGLLTSWGDKWFTRRKIITPSFHFSILDGFVDVMSKQSDILLKYFSENTGKGEVDIYPIINAFALDVICETSMGVTVDAQANPHSEYVTSVKKASSSIQHRGQHPLGRSNLYDLTSEGQHLKKLTKILHDFTNKVITERRDQLLDGGGTDDKGGRMNFIDILLHANVDGKPLSNSDIREEVDTFMFEGHDTTASGITFTLYLLARYPDIQEKLYQELIDVFGSKDNLEISKKKFNELKYLDWIIKESLRVLPPVPFIGRQLMEDTVISGVTVPSGINLGLNIYAMHHDPDNFDNPEKFDPERFNPVNMTSKKNFAYVPFSAGGRNCIGQKFAMLDLKIAVTKIIMNFKLLPGPEVILQGDLILKAADGVRVRVEAR